MPNHWSLIADNWQKRPARARPFLRRGRDSNPRYPYSRYAGLANRWFQPLTHLSGISNQQTSDVALNIRIAKLKERIGEPCEIDNLALSINILKGYEKIYPIVFPIWATCKILRSQGFKSRIYTDWHNTSLLTGFILSVLGATWVADVWDNPKKRLLSWKEKKANVPIYKRIYHEVQGALISVYLKKAAVIF